ncbi:MAG: hypothetical protein AB8F34_10050 [Akkermansiaceae bacterium]
MTTITQRHNSLIAQGGICAESICAPGSNVRMKRIEGYCPNSQESGFIPEQLSFTADDPDNMNHTQKGAPRSA